MKVEYSCCCRGVTNSSPVYSAVVVRSTIWPGAMRTIAIPGKRPGWTSESAITLRTPPRSQTAEMVKYVDNSWHALKIGFANEIGDLCKSLGLGAHEVMKILCRDQKLNVSTAHLLTGFVGANGDFILNRIPHISRLMVDHAEAVLDFAQTIVIGNRDPEFAGVSDKLHVGLSIVDFMRISDRRSENGKYDGI